jgi:hypothetical protein
MKRTSPGEEVPFCHKVEKCKTSRNYDEKD